MPSISLTNNPNAYAELVRQAMLWAMLMGFIHLTEAQQLGTLSLVSAILAVIVWTQVMPTKTIEDAGHNVAQIKSDAKINVAQANMEQAKADAKSKRP